MLTFSPSLLGVRLSLVSRARLRVAVVTVRPALAATWGTVNHTVVLSATVPTSLYCGSAVASASQRSQTTVQAELAAAHRPSPDTARYRVQLAASSASSTRGTACTGAVEYRNWVQTTYLSGSELCCVGQAGQQQGGQADPHLHQQAEQHRPGLHQSAHITPARAVVFHKIVG